MKVVTNMSEIRKRAATLARELRTVKTPNLTMRQRNAAIRSHMRVLINKERTQPKSACRDPDMLEFFIGSRFLSALVNGDYTGISGAESKALDAWVKEQTEEFKQGHWSVTDYMDEFGVCAVTGQRGNVTKVNFVIMER